MIRLLIRTGGQSRELSFDGAVVNFGSGAECKVCVDDPQADAEQCRIEKVPNGWKLVDLESTNGTSVNGAVVNARLLKDGDVIRIGEFEAVFNPGGASRTGKPSRAAARAGADAMFWIKTGGVAAAVLIATVVGIKVFVGDDKAAAQRDSLKAAQQTAGNGDLEAAEAAINALLSAPIDPGVQRDAKKSLDDVRAKIASRNEREQRELEAAIAAEEARRRADEFRVLFDEATTESDRLVVQENFGEALNVWKSFARETTDAEFASKIDGRTKEVLKASQDAWDALETRANSLVKMEEYPQAALAVAAAIERFQGTRFRYRAQEKLEGIRRLMGVTSAYVAGGASLTAGAQDSLLAIDDLVKARRYGQALRQIDGLLSSVTADHSAALRAQRAEIAAQGELFGKLVAAVNNGWFTSHPIELGNGTRAILAKANDEVLDVEFKDEEGKGGTSSRKWPQVDAEDMLGYFRAIELGPEDTIALAAFCYSNGLTFAGAEILSAAIASDPLKKPAAFELVARHRGIPIPDGGFVWYEGGWYTSEELKFAKLDLDVKKAALLLGNIDAKKAAEGMALYRRATSDPSAGTEVKSKAVTLCVGALKTRRTAILRRLQDSRGLVNPAVMTALKKDLIKRRQAAIKVIFDVKIYPEENHGIVGQPTVDAAVGKVRELWDNPLQVVSKANPAIENMIAASQQTDDWLRELGASATEAEKALVAKLLLQVNDALSLKNYCISGNERSQLEKFRAIMSYNDRHLGFDSREKDCIRATNEYRFMLGIQAVEAQDQLGRAARKHSVEMEKLGYFAHVGPTKGLATPGERCAAEGYGGGGAENIAMGNVEGEPTFLQWYNSSGHHRNMLGGHTQIGIGRSNNYWTENFGSSGPSMKDKTSDAGVKGASVAGGSTGGVTCEDGR
ncbi:MAG: FHA domain-containing protein [Planctomycetota bacterium]